VRGDGADFAPQPGLERLDELVHEVRDAGLDVVVTVARSTISRSARRRRCACSQADSLMRRSRSASTSARQRSRATSPPFCASSRYATACRP
jgi:hypothetical protein